MKFKDLGNDGLRVSAIGLGCMGMSRAYGAAPDRREMSGLLANAVDMGYTFFDTAESYGTAARPHDGEELLGEALRPFRDKVVLATKFGISFEHPEAPGTHAVITDSRPETIRRSVEGSLRRLQTDHIDLYYQHRTDPNVEPETVATVMADQIKEGKILHWGLSEASVDYLRRAHSVCPVTAVQNRYSMMARWNESLFPVLEELGIGLVASSPMPTACSRSAIRQATVSTRQPTTAPPCHSSRKKASNRTRPCLPFLTNWPHRSTPHPRKSPLPG